MLPAARPPCPAFLIAGTASGQGKTSITAALARLHARQGRRVRVFKCGPDFLDPMILARASGQPVDNVDLWMTGLDDARWRIETARATHDLVLVESVMGLHDGTPSSAALAVALDLRVVAVIDAAAMAQTLGALAQGLFSYRPPSGDGLDMGLDPRRDGPAAVDAASPCPAPDRAAAPVSWALPVGGVFANRVGSASHARMLQESLPAGLPWLGHLGRDLPSLPERHLGLVSAAEIPDLDAHLDRWAEAMAVAVAGTLLAPPEALKTWPQSDGNAPMAPPAPGGDVPGGPATASRSGMSTSAPALAARPPALRDQPLRLAGRRIALASDAAFCFVYPANVQVLEALGATVQRFSPLAGETVPAGTDALWLPGGYPELHGPALAASPFLAGLRDWVVRGGRVWAECGGLMVLTEALETVDGECVPMAGLLPGRVRMQARLEALGLQSLALPAGTLRGHSFHYSVGEGLPAGRWLTVPQRWGAPEAVIEQRLGQGLVRASYFHPWFASAPIAAASLFEVHDD